MEVTMDGTICEDLCAVEQPELPTNYTVRFSREELMPIMQKSFQKFGDVHWSMLAAKVPDTYTLTALIDVVTDIIQAISAEALRVVLQIMTEVKAALPAGRGNFTICLGDSFSASIAWALSMPEEKCPSVEALREMVEMEVSEKVNSAVFLAMNSQVLPPESVIYVSGSKSRIGNLRRMVRHAAVVLRRYAVKMCSGQLDDSSDFEESTESLQSVISVAAAESVRCESQQARSEIVDNIMSDKSHRLQASKDTDADSQTAKEHHNFFKTAKRRFEKMVSDLKSCFKKKDAEFLVDLKQEPGQSPRSAEAAGSDEFSLPGSVPESPRLASRSTPTPNRLVRSVKRHTPVDFMSIKSDLNKLFKGSDVAGKMLENMMSRGEIQKFSRELTDKMYDHLMVDCTYEIPVAPLGRCLSDSILSKARREVGQSHLQFSPDVVYAMTEDAVGKFLQSLLLSKSISEEISFEQGVAVPLPMTEPRTSSSSAKRATDLIASPKSEAEERRIREQDVPAPSKKPTPKLAFVSHSCPIAVSEKMTLEQCAASAPVPLLITLKSSSSAEKTADLIASAKPEAKRSDVQPEMSQDVADAISALLLKVMTKSLDKCKKQVTAEDFKVILRRLSELPLDDTSVSSDRITKKSEKISKAMVKDLHEAFGSSEKLMEAVMALEDPSFDDTFMRILKIHLKLISSPKPQCCIVRLFSKVGRAFKNFFGRGD